MVHLTNNKTKLRDFGRRALLTFEGSYRRVDFGYWYNIRKKTTTWFQHRFNNVSNFSNVTVLSFALSTDERAIIYRPFIDPQFSFGLAKFSVSIISKSVPLQVEETLIGQHLMCFGPNKKTILFRNNSCPRNSAQTEPLKGFVFRGKFMLFGKKEVYQFDVEAFNNPYKWEPVITKSYDEWIDCGSSQGKRFE